MKLRSYTSSSLFLILFLILLSTSIHSQNRDTDLEKYKTFLQANQNMTNSDLQNMFDAGSFTDSRSFQSEYLYLDSIEIKLGLTDYEKELLNKHGFMVTERLTGNSIGQQFLEIYHKDLPVYVSSDAILHAFHMSYDEILKNIELGFLIDNVTTLLAELKAGIPDLENRYSSMPQSVQNLKDIDVFLTVPLRILNGTEIAYYPDNESFVNELLGYISNLRFEEIGFFSETPRKIDFSQFKVRGHYEDEYHPELGKYFQAMIWLGRMELYLIAPETAMNKPTQEEVQRQTINSLLLSELIEVRNQKNLYENTEAILTAFVGAQDNVTLENLEYLKNELNIAGSFDLFDTNKFNQFQNKLSEESFAFQRILSQVLMNNPSTPDSIRPASAFMLFGQRFVIDSYITGNVVFDKIKFQGEFVRRMLPSTLDVLFALGNNAAGQLLQDELETYPYASNLSGLRYLVDNHSDEFWNESIYNSWLNAIRSLNPPDERENLPQFMQTAAWWQHKMNTQLAGWTELRHDNLLYAKQSYTGGVTCSYPYSFVEPVPEFFIKMGLLASNASDKISEIQFTDNYYRLSIVNYLTNFKNITDTLATIAGKELSGEALAENEIDFLKNMLSDTPMCGGLYNGWFVDLFFNHVYEEGLLKEDKVVADYHTAPTDASGNFVGWVKHAGTGSVDMAVITTQLPSGENIAFTGPVMSYHEYTTTNFQRLSDSEWKESYYFTSTRPDWVNIYLAGREGNSLGEGRQLLTGIEEIPAGENPVPESHILASNYPNPFNNGTVISFTVPALLSNKHTEVMVYDFLGQKVTSLVNNILPSGNYKTRWYGQDDNGTYVASGVYFYVVRIGPQQFVGKMNLLK